MPMDAHELPTHGSSYLMLSGFFPRADARPKMFITVNSGLLLYIHVCRLPNNVNMSEMRVGVRIA